MKIKIALTLLGALLISSCSSTNKKDELPENIVSLGNGVYVSSAGSSVAYQKAFNKAINDASAYCEKMGKVSKIQDIQRPSSGLYEVMVYFGCN